jgi:hypothetical protein
VNERKPLVTGYTWNDLVAGGCIEYVDTEVGKPTLKAPGTKHLKL